MAELYGDNPFLEDIGSRGGFTGWAHQKLFPRGIGNILMGRSVEPMPAIESPEFAEYISDFAMPGIFIGEKGAAKLGSDLLDRLVIAKRLHAEGLRPEDVWADTFWFKGPDGKWRTELDDSAAALTKARGSKYPVQIDTRPALEQFHAPKQYNPLSKYIMHNDLMIAYPDLPNLNTSIHYNKGGEISGGLHTKYGNPVEIVLNAPNKEEMRGGLLHEMQHYVQNAEDFAPGGSPESILSDPKFKNKLNNEYSRIIDKYPHKAADGDEVAFFKRIAADNLYRRLVGEAEAYDTSFRANFPLFKREITSPALLYRDDLILY